MIALATNGEKVTVFDPDKFVRLFRKTCRKRAPEAADAKKDLSVVDREKFERILWIAIDGDYITSSDIAEFSEEDIATVLGYFADMDLSGGFSAQGNVDNPVLDILLMNEMVGRFSELKPAPAPGGYY